MAGVNCQNKFCALEPSSIIGPRPTLREALCPVPRAQAPASATLRLGPLAAHFSRAERAALAGASCLLNLFTSICFAAPDN